MNYPKRTADIDWEILEWSFVDEFKIAKSEAHQIANIIQLFIIQAKEECQEGTRSGSSAQAS